MSQLTLSCRWQHKRIDEGSKVIIKLENVIDSCVRDAQESDNLFNWQLNLMIPDDNSLLQCGWCR
ncbi:hypothetical protein PAXRUDRAFT_690084, partial [Paxillus rubicundulus Ve08.2h10]